MIGIIAMIVLAGMGVLCLVSPKTVTRADKRDDPEAVEQIRKAGYLLIGFAAAAGFLALKYTLL